jgi:hypothetical protein
MLESWDTIKARVNELRLDYWGAPEEVAVMAAPVRWAGGRREASNILKEIAAHGPLTSKSGLIARLRRRSIGKLVSSVAIHSSFSPEAHYLAAANVDKFFSNAIEPWLFELNPNKNNEGLKARHYLFAPMDYQGNILIVKFTVKEYYKADSNIYSIEALELVQKNRTLVCDGVVSFDPLHPSR